MAVGRPGEGVAPPNCLRVNLSDRGRVAMSKWHVYIIRTRSGTLYIGTTTNVARRLAEHGERGRRGAKYLRGRGPLTLAYHVKVGDRTLAAKVEWRIKRLSKQRKEEIVSAKLTRKALLALFDLVE